MLIYISTDYVFDGTKPPYEVGDKPNPLNFYGQTKLDGEEAIKSVYPEAVILRVPILYGSTEYNAESAINVLIDVVLVWYMFFSEEGATTWHDFLIDFFIVCV